MSWKDPALEGIKAIPLPRGGVLVKCMRSCRMSGQRVTNRLANMSEAHAWAVEHRVLYPQHGDQG